MSRDSLDFIEKQTDKLLNEWRVSAITTREIVKKAILSGMDNSHLKDDVYTLKRYEIVLDQGGTYKDGYIGPWGIYENATFYDDFKDALELIFEWGLNKKGDPRKHNKIGIYDHMDDKFYTQAACFKFEGLIYEKPE